jgi:hypothetical protein
MKKQIKKLKSLYKKFIRTITNKRELWIWFTWTFFKDEFLEHNRGLVGENLDFGKLLQRKETIRVLLELQKEYEKVVHGHVALSVINDLIEIIEKGRLGANGQKNVD